MNYVSFLQEELLTALGCTEPIAIAYTAAEAAKALGQTPTKIEAKLSSNIIKNANSVTVPSTNGRKGIDISLAAGAFLGFADKKLEVLSGIDKSRLEMCDEFIADGNIDVELYPDHPGVYIEVIVRNGSDYARVITEESHTNVILIEKNSEVLYESEARSVEEETSIDMDFDSIYEFSKNGDYSELVELLDRQIEYNLAIAEEGLKNDWGSNIGSMMLETDSSDYFNKLAAYAAAGSDARMSGSEMPVVINAGSGNQGITVSVPIIVYAKDNPKDDENLYRALIFANLISLYIKEGIGKLSAYCGAVSAASASFAGIAFYEGESKEVIEDTVSNNLAGVSGIICDGAKPSCAMKIGASLRNASLSYKQAKLNESFERGDGVVKENIDRTISGIGNIAKDGMKETDKVILEEMLDTERIN